uniref:RWP-RK domain-containing protein n=1 Tax=Guillardia theta TaxID=55529 RepID=A0A7S4NPG4_GUITH|mmetsp:Transcript_27820/g.90490  ORF Transcript_27820/g.90490 Transcript_27820/m.90490 type:complete len:159 (+) Transcript_27820:389-865(+)
MQSAYTPSSSDSDSETSKHTAQVLPRKCFLKDSKERVGGAVVLSPASLSKLFHMRQLDAAKHLGISLTSLKSACRRIGLDRWPYERTYERMSERGCRKGSRKGRKESARESGKELEETRGGYGEAYSLFDEALEHVEGVSRKKNTYLNYADVLNSSLQ